MLYHPTLPTPLPPSLQEHTLTFTGTDGTELFGLHLAAQPGKPTVVYSNGNAGDLMVAPYLAALGEWQTDGLGLFAYDYPGYGRSGGSPSEASLYAALEGAVQYLTQREVPLAQQVLVGWSLGGGVTCDVAARLPVGGVALVSTFTSVPDLLETMVTLSGYPAMEARRLPEYGQRYANLEKVGRITAPLRIVHGQLDALCPVEGAKALYEAATAPDKQLVVYPQVDHNGMLNEVQFARDIAAFALQLQPANLQARP